MKNKQSERGYHKFIEKHTSPIKTSPQVESNDLCEQDSPDFGRIEHSGNQNNILQNGLLDNEDNSKDSVSCDSETPIPNIPVPISPEMNKFPKFKQEAFIENMNKHQFQRNSMSVTPNTQKLPKAQLLIPESVQEQSIDSFIKQKGNEFIASNKALQKEGNVVSERNENIKVVSTFTKKFTPMKKYSCQVASMTPTNAGTFSKKYQIKRSSDQDNLKPELTTYKSEEKSLFKKIPVQKPEIVQKSMTDITPFTNNYVAPYTPIRNEETEIRPKRETESETRSGKSLFGMLTQKISPLLSIIKNTDKDTKSENGYVKSSALNYRNENPLKYGTPRITKQNDIEMIDTFHKNDQFSLRSKFEPKTEVKKLDKKQ